VKRAPRHIDEELHCLASIIVSCGASPAYHLRRECRGDPRAIAAVSGA
jgi:HD-like signal output (HDOD) protein